MAKKATVASETMQQDQQQVESRAAFDKTNTCTVNIVTAGEHSKNAGKKYSLFICNIDGIELTGILNSSQGNLSGFLKRNKDQKNADATVTIERVNSTNIDAPVFRGMITTKKGNKFELALWEQFGAEYHFWSGKIKPEGEKIVKADDGSNPFLEEFEKGIEVRSNPDSRNQNRSAAFTIDSDDLPF